MQSVAIPQLGEGGIRYRWGAGRGRQLKGEVEMKTEGAGGSEKRGEDADGAR